MDSPEVLVQTLPHRIDLAEARRIGLIMMFRRLWWLMAILLVLAVVLWVVHGPMWLVVLCALYAPLALTIEVERRLRRDRRHFERERTSTFGKTTWTIDVDSGSRSEIRYADLDRAYELGGSLMLEMTRDATYWVPLHRFKSPTDLETVRGLLRSAGLMKD